MTGIRIWIRLQSIRTTMHTGRRTLRVSFRKRPPPGKQYPSVLNVVLEDHATSSKCCFRLPCSSKSLFARFAIRWARMQDTSKVADSGPSEIRSEMSRFCADEKPGEPGGTGLVDVRTGAGAEV
jgi:hypothetical protein